MMNEINSQLVRHRRQIPTVVFAVIIIVSFYVAIMFAAFSVLLLSGYTWIS